MGSEATRFSSTNLCIQKESGGSNPTFRLFYRELVVRRG